MEFSNTLNLSTLRGMAIYRRAEHGLDFVPSDQELAMAHVGEEGLTSILLGTVQVEISIASRQLLYVWGYAPRPSWRETTAQWPAAAPRAVVVRRTRLLPGISVGVPGSWPIAFNSEGGWLVIGDVSAAAMADHYEFATGTLASLLRARLVAVWVKPQWV